LTPPYEGAGLCSSRLRAACHARPALAAPTLYAQPGELLESALDELIAKACELDMAEVVTELCEHPGAGDRAHAGHREVDLSVWVRVKMCTAQCQNPRPSQVITALQAVRSCRELVCARAE
jgi:hypothetical protein